MQRRGEIVLWPVYFDSTKTRAEGRRVSKRLAKPSSTPSTIEQALGKLGLNCTSVADSAHPYYPWKKTGFVVVKKTEPKNQLLKKVASGL